MEPKSKYKTVRDKAPDTETPTTPPKPVIEEPSSDVILVDALREYIRAVIREEVARALAVV